MLTWSAKDPFEEVPYYFDFTNDIGDPTDSIPSLGYVLAVTQGTVTKSTDSVASNIITVWIAGGVQGEVCRVQAEVTTTKGQKLAETAVFEICKR